jgi:hypothetical protein
MVKTNAELYSTIGKFFPFAVGAKPGIFTANVRNGITFLNAISVSMQDLCIPI